MDTASPTPSPRPLGLTILCPLLLAYGIAWPLLMIIAMGKLAGSWERFEWERFEWEMLEVYRISPRIVFIHFILGSIEPFAVSLGILLCAAGLWYRHKWARVVFLCGGLLHFGWLVGSQLIVWVERDIFGSTIFDNRTFFIPWLDILCFSAVILYLYLRVPETYFREADPTTIIKIQKS